MSFIGLVCLRQELTRVSEEQMPQPEQEQESIGGDSLKMDLYFWLQALVMALVSLILVFTLAGRIIGVDGTSMIPTLHDRDMLLLRSIGYHPEQGDVVVITKKSFMDQPIVKRVIAVGGQTVRIDYTQGLVYVDGVALDESYLGEMMVEPGSLFMTNDTLTVPEGSIFVMGDNRNHSTDSRDVRLGTVDERYVLGKALFVLIPFGDMGVIE